jgi:uncharacterized membrane protein YeaQ/YmgE (transglycosylase-associated protein family)
MGIITWIIMGALAGWFASMIAGNNASQGAIGNIIVGILGAFLGGWLMRMFGQGGADLGTFNLYSLLVATLGAVLLLFIYGMLTKRQ